MHNHAHVPGKELISTQPWLQLYQPSISLSLIAPPWILPMRLARIAAEAAIASCLEDGSPSASDNPLDGSLSIADLQGVDPSVDDDAADPIWRADEDDVAVFYVDGLEDDEEQYLRLDKVQQDASLDLLGSLNAAALQDQGGLVKRLLAKRGFDRDDKLLFGTLDIVALEAKQQKKLQQRQAQPNGTSTELRTTHSKRAKAAVDSEDDDAEDSRTEPGWL
jgi:hypothetical protein